MTNLLLLGFLPSGSEWLIILLVILLLFGGKKIPELMRGLGKGVKSFKEGVSEGRNQQGERRNRRTGGQGREEMRGKVVPDSGRIAYGG